MSSTPAWLTAEYLQKLLSESFNDKELKLKDFDVSSGSSLGDGYASQIFRIKINTNKKKISIIAKVLLNSSAVELIEGILNVYAKEKMMLRSVLPTSLTKLSNPVAFFPGFYHADDDHRTLFLEDLCADGFQLCNHKCNGVDLQHSLLVMEALAKYHGTSYLTFKENPTLTKNFEKYFQSEENKAFLEGMIKHTHKNLVEALDDLNLPEEYKKKLQNSDNWCAKVIETWKRKDDQFNVLIQTDCWLNNLMFKYNTNGVEAVKMVDFQLATYHCFAFDLISFIFSSTNINIITNHMHTLIDRYYDVLTGITGETENFSKERLWKEFNERLFLGFISTISMVPVIIAPQKGKHVDIDAVMEGGSQPNTEIYKNPKFLEHLEKLLPYFVQHNVI